jgi:biofilm protein TabA
MLLDHLSNATVHTSLDTRYKLALQWLTDHRDTLAHTDNGRIDILGDEVYAIINRYDTKPATQCGWEAHHRYADIHYSVTGSEYIGYAPLDTMTEIQAYDADKDYLLYSGNGEWLHVEQGVFCILLPSDVHAPGAMVGDVSTFLKKVVIKVLI